MDLVLIIDKSSALIDEVETVLAGARCRFVSTHSYAKGLAYARSGSPDAILLGIYRELRNSLETLREIRTDALARRIPVITIFSKPDDVMLGKIKQIGISEIIMRPIDRPSALEKLRSVLNLEHDLEEKTARERVSHVVVSHPSAMITMIEFKSGLKRFALPQFKALFTVEFRTKTRGNEFCVDLRDLPDLDMEEAGILEKLVPVFPGPVVFIAGKHLGTLLAFSSIDERARLFFSPEEYTQYLDLISRG